VVGLVENFDKSMLDYQDFIRPYFSHFEAISVHANVTSKGRSVEENVVRFGDRIGDETFQLLLELNKLDLDLYKMVKSNYF